MECSGNGQCLTFSRNKIICDKKCEPIRCANFTLCGNTGAGFILEFNSGVCEDCFSKFGVCLENLSPSNPCLEFKEESINLECPICMVQCNVHVKCPRCTHWLCLQCIDKIYSLDYICFQNPPKFPLSDFEYTLYEKDASLFNAEVSVQKWRAKYKRWEHKKNTYVQKKKKFIRHCPICRL